VGRRQGGEGLERENQNGSFGAVLVNGKTGVRLRL